MAVAECGIRENLAKYYGQKSAPARLQGVGGEAGQTPILLTRSRRGRLRRTAPAPYWCRTPRSVQLIQPGAAAAVITVPLSIPWQKAAVQKIPGNPVASWLIAKGDPAGAAGTPPPSEEHTSET